MSQQLFHHFLLYKFFSLCSTDSQMWSFSNFQSVLMPHLVAHNVIKEWFLLWARVSFSNGCLLQWERRFDLWEMSFSEHIVRSCSRLLNSTPMSVSPFFRHRPPSQPSLTNIYLYKKCKVWNIKSPGQALCFHYFCLWLYKCYNYKQQNVTGKFFPAVRSTFPLWAAPLASISKPHKRLRNPYCSG